MPRPRNPIQTVFINLGIRGDLKAKLDLLLWSTLENRVPHGAYKEFFEELMEAYFKTKGN
jgi:hypothetical protein